MYESTLIEIPRKIFKDKCLNNERIDKQSLEKVQKLACIELFNERALDMSDNDLEKYYNCELLIKLAEESPINRLDIYLQGAKLLRQAPEYQEIISSICDSILMNEINYSERVLELLS